MVGKNQDRTIPRRKSLKIINIKIKITCFFFFWTEELTCKRKKSIFVQQNLIISHKTSNPRKYLSLYKIEPYQILMEGWFSEQNLFLLYLGDYNFFYRLLALFIKMCVPQADKCSTKNRYICDIKKNLESKHFFKSGTFELRLTHHY